MIQYYVVRLVPYTTQEPEGTKRVRKRYRGRAYLERQTRFAPLVRFSLIELFLFLLPPLALPHFRFFAIRAASPPASQERQTLSLSPYQKVEVAQITPHILYAYVAPSSLQNLFSTS